MSMAPPDTKRNGRARGGPVKASVPCWLETVDDCVPVELPLLVVDDGATELLPAGATVGVVAGGVVVAVAEAAWIANGAENTLGEVKSF